MTNVTIGQYYPENSIIHRLDPRVKLFGTLVFIVLLFITNNLFGYIMLSLFVLGVIIASKVPFSRMLKGLKGILVIIILSVIINLFTTPGETVLTFKSLKITKEGLEISGYLVWRLVLMVVGTTVMTLTTSPTDIADGMEKSLRVLNLIKIPVHEISMIMSLALRFIPTLMEEMNKITKAQKARGVNLETGNIFKRVKSLIPILIPLFISSIRRAMELAYAMEARCYHGGKRTKMKPLKYKKADAVGYLVCFALIALMVCANIAVLRIDSMSRFISSI